MTKQTDMRINKDTPIDELAPVKDTVKKLYDALNSLDIHLTIMQNQRDEDDHYLDVQYEMDALGIFTFTSNLMDMLGLEKDE